MKKPKRYGFSLIEVVVAIAALGVIASVAYSAFGRAREAAREEKLQTDVKTLNQAVSVYLAGGGSLEGADTAGKVLNNLKKTAKGDVADRMPGISSSVIDPRISVEMQDDQEGETGELRAYWDTEAMRFTLANQGRQGIKRFTFDEDLAEEDFGEEDRNAAMLYASADGWVWDHQDFGRAARTVPTVVTTNPAPSGIPAGGAPTGAPPTVLPTLGILLGPEFSLPGDSYPITDYDLTVSLTDPNPPGLSDLYYALDGGALTPYVGPLTVPPGTIVEAKAISAHERWVDSARRSQAYAAEAVNLSPPVIEPDQESFGLFFGTDINVTLTEPNDPGLAEIRYRLDGGSWMTYTAPFELLRDDYPAGVVVEAQTISSTGSPYYLSSTVSSRTLGYESLDLTGTIEGNYSNPAGSSNMISNLPSGTSAQTFQWGDGNGIGRSQSWMRFDGDPFGDVSEGERFQVGEMTYYNGTIASGSGATTVDLAVELNLDINGNVFQPFFDFTFELINTPNTGDPWPSADYVLIEDATASRTLIINDYEYEFRLEFGETTSNGFANFNEFHVLENAEAMVNVYGTFVGIGPTGDPDPDPDPAPGGGIFTGEVSQREGYVDPQEGAKLAKESAKVARDNAKDGAEDAESAAGHAESKEADTIQKIGEGKLDEAVVKAEEARSYADLAVAAEQLAAESLAITTQLAIDATNYAAKDPAAQDDADDTLAYHYETQDFYTRAKNAMDRALAAADAAEAAVGGLPAGYMDPGDAKNIAKSARDDADHAADEAENDLADTDKKFGEGKFDEAVAFAASAEAFAQEAEALEAAAAEAVTGAQVAATYWATVAAGDSNYQNDADDAQDLYVEAAGYLAEAEASADRARVAADAAAAAVATVPDGYINPQDARNAAKAGRDKAKSAADHAEDDEADAIKKMGEGKPDEAQEFAVEARNNANLAIFEEGNAAAGVNAAQIAATYWASLAASDPDFQDGSDDAQAYLIEAQGFYSEAQGHLVRALAAADGAEAAVNP